MVQDISIAQAMRMGRDKRKFSMAEMAKWLGISRRHYWAIETGRCRNPRMSTYWKLLQEDCRLEMNGECTQMPDHYHLVSDKELRESR